ncbi:unnamed protein product [Didymodactylos carnosus]|uniref:V-SNARE coiled-coil homology domain-containing protein n=1 Tax=Didymodactylos carnosus TaxID=1234261 RepID=A0A815YL32_9BILA|nr:unnamed protein product [Didymodactylos carnosus]CAF1571665.1 unnamed protein product [Didymodactylos carnosus]CAF4172128.1 unnamed protein product [Didymodactylos carnosus]CAF4435168.1 unnamed protein product [Didymodactylos carnosus]
MSHQTAIRTDELHGQVIEVQDIVEKNIGHMLILRDEELEKLQKQSECLNKQAHIFAENSKLLEHKMSWKNYKKVWIIAIMILILLIIFIIISITLASR